MYTRKFYKCSVSTDSHTWRFPPLISACQQGQVNGHSSPSHFSASLGSARNSFRSFCGPISYGSERRLLQAMQQYLGAGNANSPAEKTTTKLCCNPTSVIFVSSKANNYVVSRTAPSEAEENCSKSHRATVLQSSVRIRYQDRLWRLPSRPFPVYTTHGAWGDSVTMCHTRLPCL